jgi:hypothetical protein
LGASGLTVIEEQAREKAGREGERESKFPQ